MSVVEKQSDVSRRTVQCLYDIAGRADWDAMTAVLAPDVVLYEPEWLPYGGEYQGLDGVTCGLRSIFYDHLELQELDVVAVTSYGSHAVGWLKLGGLIRATGRPFSQATLEAFEVNDEGMVETIRVFWSDGPELLRAFEP